MDHRTRVNRLLAALLVVGLVVRLALIGSAGFKNDIGLFGYWATMVVVHPLSQFYATGGFVDYPPGYLYVLGFIGFVWDAFFKNAAHAGAILDVLVKLPAVLADLAVGALLYRLVSRYASAWWALGAAALYVLNPATIVVSAVWGQVDAISGGLALLGVYLLMRADARPERTYGYVVGAWLSLAASLLIKPQAALLIALFVAFAVANAAQRAARVKATGLGIACAIALAALVAVPFHPTWNPFALGAWLLGRYAFGASHYAYNSVNAFNLWTIFRAFWIPDTPVQAAIGWALALAATALAVWRYLQVRTAAVFLQCCALTLLAFFLLMTRMHERYIFDAVLFLIACIAIDRRYLFAAIFFSCTLTANLVYSLEYLRAMDGHLPLNSRDLWGPIDHAISLLNVLAFFWLGYALLDTERDADGAQTPARIVSSSALPPEVPAVAALPEDGAVGMQGWIDYAVAGGLGLFSFVLSFVNYWLPATKYFDEIYFPKAGEEYLLHQPIYENTHPPLAKLIITLSMVLFGGMHGLGDTPWGWRFMDVLCGAIVVVLLYILAKRVTGSTVFSAIAALLLTFDGMHFVQSRISTPEGIVVVFSVAAVYTFYRFWLSATTDARADRGASEGLWGVLLSLAGGTALSLIVVKLVFAQSTAATVIAAIYFAFGLYVLLRATILPRLRPDASVAPNAAARWWLVAFSVALGCLVSSKWYGIMGFGVCFVVLAAVWSQGWWLRGEAPQWGDSRGFRLDVALCTVVFLTASVYTLSWTKDVMNQQDIHNLTNIVERQQSMFEYHDHLNDGGRNEHPYASKWWQWPLDLRPVYYYANFQPNARRVIYSLPNPIILWFGLICVPWVGYLAWRERRKGYALIVVTYLLQWLPWMASPRITFAYHFYVDIPLICLCNAIVLQRIWAWGSARNRGWATASVGGYVLLAAAAFVFFYPILAGTPISDAYWNATQWLPSWT